MKKTIMVASILAWLSVPFICRSGFQYLFAELRDASLLLYRTCQAAGVDMDNDPWRSCLKRSNERLAFRVRDKYILPIGFVWITVGAGLITGLRETRRSSNKPSRPIAGKPGSG